jgi:cell division protein FtsQ
VADVDTVLASARKRFQRRQWARRWLVARWPLLAVVLGLVVAGTAWLIFASSVFDLRRIDVEGARIVSQEEIERAAGVEDGTPLARIDLAEVERRVEALAAVRTAEVARSWPHGIEVTLSEREAVAAVSKDGDTWALDSEGVLFAQIVAVPAGMPEIHAGAWISQDALREGASVVAALPVRLSRQVAFVDVRTVDNISLHMRNGDLVRWGNASQTDAKAAVLTLLLHQVGSVFDVSSPGQPTVRP